VAIESSSKKRAEKIDFVAAELAGEVKTDSEEGSTPAKTRGNSRAVFMAQQRETNEQLLATEREKIDQARAEAEACTGRQDKAVAR